MIISKAIEIHTDTYHQYEKHLLSDQRDAHKLGIEALKRIKECRQHPFSKTVSPLPGESIPEREIR